MNRSFMRFERMRSGYRLSFFKETHQHSSCMDKSIYTPKIALRYAHISRPSHYTPPHPPSLPPRKRTSTPPLTHQPLPPLLHLLPPHLLQRLRPNLVQQIALRLVRLPRDRSPAQPLDPRHRSPPVPERGFGIPGLNLVHGSVVATIGVWLFGNGVVAQEVWSWEGKVAER